MTRYNTPAIALHWLIAALLLGTFGFGIYVEDLPFSPEKLKLVNWHKWAGITVLALTLVRLAWRILNPPPPLPMAVHAAMPHWQRAAHAGTHHLLYALCFVVPMLGWMYSSARGFPVVWFGVVPLPDLVGKDKPLADMLKGAHALAAFSLMGLIVLHLAAALKHQFIDRDRLIARMWPGSTRDLA